MGDDSESLTPPPRPAQPVGIGSSEQTIELSWTMPDAGNDEELEACRSYEVSYGKRGSAEMLHRTLPLPRESVRAEGYGAMQEFGATISNLAGPGVKCALRGVVAATS